MGGNTGGGGNDGGNVDEDQCEELKNNLEETRSRARECVEMECSMQELT